MVCCFSQVALAPHCHIVILRFGVIEFARGNHVNLRAILNNHLPRYSPSPYCTAFQFVRQGCRSRFTRPALDLPQRSAKRVFAERLQQIVHRRGIERALHTDRTQ